MSLRRRNTGNSWIWKHRDANGQWRQRSAFIGPCETLEAGLQWFMGMRAIAQQRIDDAASQNMRYLADDAHDDLTEANERIAAIREAMLHESNREAEKQQRHMANHNRTQHERGEAELGRILGPDRPRHLERRER